MVHVATLNIIIQAYIEWVYIVKCIMCLLADYVIQLYMLQHWIIIIIIILSCHIMLSSIMSWFNFNLIYEMQADMQSADNYPVILSIELIVRSWLH